VLPSRRYLHARNSVPSGTKSAQKAGKEPALTLEEAKAQIEASFRTAKEVPVHPNKPELRPVSVMPVLPYFERYGNMYVTASSTSEVVTHVLAENTTAEERKAIYGRCLLRTYPVRMLFLCMLCCS
jgi:hypothetical protein